ncbi:hypothetical protein NLM33_15370 [Bradyrhizobium sp. CCGUVB1N3]|uniref:alpha/beta fold hydrolase n=1 Tax=Bradyrhizobium sp. CCGUVB1N3 TaxID=2949629 RepID=UPI0020B2D96B|nr:hypothetical protein [Bradyrhizobium sp. CCGUVB1N3]MCP3471704.1 hypothetical protein [Bradyrhizobium sp. CCGUVB1N3]
MDIGRRNAFKTLVGATLAAATAPQALARSVEIESRIARLNGCDIHYRVAGSGPTVMLLHGWPQTSFAWLGVMHRLADLYRLIAPDIRGTGLSEKTVSRFWISLGPTALPWSHSALCGPGALGCNTTLGPIIRPNILFHDARIFDLYHVRRRMHLAEKKAAETTLCFEIGSRMKDRPYSR